MSRIGKEPITIPAGVEVKVADGNVVTVKGSKGTLEKKMHANMTISVEGNEVKVSRPNDDNHALKSSRSSLVYNIPPIFVQDAINLVA